MNKTHSETGWAYGVIFDDLGACGCGQFEERLKLVRQALRDCPLYESERWRAYDSPLGEWFLCLLTDADLIEHGGTVGGSWITDKGKRLLTVLGDDAKFRSFTDHDAPTGYCECAECGYV